MKTLILAAAALAATIPAAHAEFACNSEIAKTVSDWQAIKLVPTPKPAAISKGVGTHAHVQAEVDSMRFHLGAAKSLCREGQDHESLLHLDVLRAFLALPEIRHPSDHRYIYWEYKGSPSYPPG
jgi:hypothetical protein